MNRTSPIETRLTELFAAYADRAPVDVEPVATARLVAEGAARRRARPGASSLIDRSPALVFLVVALLVAIAAGALVVGRELARDDLRMLTDRAIVEPFTGLPPEGAAPSTPETGELVLGFDGRVYSVDLDFHRMWVYADGRLIWKSNLDGVVAGGREWRSRFGASEPTTAVIEQRLTPLGVELLRSEVMSTAVVGQPHHLGEDPTAWGRPGVLWGGMTVRIADETFTATWSDPTLPRRLANPASWLPASAWADQRIGAYVPSRYAVCIEPRGLVGGLPEPAASLIRSRSLEIVAPNPGDMDPRCPYQVTTDDARAIAAALDAAGLERERLDPLRWQRLGGFVELLPVVPNGDSVCNCG